MFSECVYKNRKYEPNKPSRDCMIFLVLSTRNWIAIQRQNGPYILLVKTKTLTHSLLLKGKATGLFQFYDFRHELGCTVPIASPKALLQLDVTCFPGVEDVNWIFSNLMLVHATFSLQFKLIATLAFDVPCISEKITLSTCTPTFY